MRDSDATARQWIRANIQGQNNGASDRQMFFMLQKLARQRRRVIGGGASSSSGVDFQGEYDPTKSYAAKAMVIFTPDGGSAGTYISAQKVAAGTSPDTGLPNWIALPNSPPGVWA